MGGSRSTRRKKKKAYWENYLVLGVSFLNRQGYCRNGGKKSGIMWGFGEQIDISVDVATVLGIRPDLRLTYVITREGRREEFNYLIPLAPVNRFRNKTNWQFVCPSKGCGRKVETLYLPINDNNFYCRHCRNLIYQNWEKQSIQKIKFSSSDGAALVAWASKYFNHYRYLPSDKLLNLAYQLLNEVKINPHTTSNLLQHLTLVHKMINEVLKRVQNETNKT